MMMMKRFLVWIVMIACAFIAALISTSFSLAFFCNRDTPSANITPPQILWPSLKDRVSFLSGSDSDHFDISGTNARRAVGEDHVSFLSGSDSDHFDISGTNARRAVRGCDYTVGRWVKSDIKPLYSGKSCKKWLAGMWACRLMPDRPNFDYENYRWQPDACDLPVFDSREFLSRMRNKVLAFVGDSIGRQQHQSMMCMLTSGKDGARVEDVSLSYGLAKSHGSTRADGVALRFLQSNTTVIYYWSASLCDIQPLNAKNPKTHYAMHLDRPVMFLQKFISVMDVVVLNTGHHWNKGKITGNKWEMHVDGHICKDRRFSSMKYARNFSLAKVVAWLDDQIEGNNTRAQIYLRSLSPRHFFEGEWDSGGRCDNNLVPIEEKKVTGQEGTDPIAEGAVMGTKVRLLNITYISLFRDEAHISKYRPHQRGQDCLHWCLPGVPDVWNELLYAKLFFDGGEPSRSTSSLISPSLMVEKPVNT